MFRESKELHSRAIVGIALTMLFSLVQAQDEKSIPFQGDETSLTRIKASPVDYVGKVFVICGGIQLDDYFNYGYDDADFSHFSLAFIQAGKDSKPTGERAHLYLSRKFGKDLIEGLVEKQEMSGKQSYVLARVTVTIPRNRFDPESWEMFEVLEVQFPNDEWSDWESGFIREAMRPKIRTWTDASGTHQIRAKFKDFKDGFVLLELESGEDRSVKADTLSKADIEYIQERLKLMSQ